jgi:hypothetical protein
MLRTTAPRLGLAAVVLASATVLTAAPALGQDATVPGIEPLSQAEADEIIADIERVAALAAEELAAFSSDRLDPALVIAEAGDDPDALREWVAANTRWVPYQGALRGADGVLLDRLGSNLDRALLLASLLEDAGLEVRLARATLPADVAAAALAAETERSLPAADAPAVITTVEELAGHRSAAQDTAAALADLVGAPPAAEDDAALAALGDHWWVQAQVDGAWMDLDPLLGADGARPQAEATIAPDALPDDQAHRVTLRVQLEDWEPDGLATWLPLEHTWELGDGSPFPSAELSFEYAFDEEPAAPLESIEDIAAQADFWRPLLWTDGERIRGEWFSTSGLDDDPTRNIISDQAEDAFGALSDLGAEEVAPTLSELSGVWLDYEVTRPGAEPISVRRELYDLLGADRPNAADLGHPMVSEEERLTRNQALLGVTDILVQGATLHPDELLRAWLQSYVDNRSALIALTSVAAGREDDRILPSFEARQPAPIELLSMAMARSNWQPTPGGTFIGAPNVWSEHLVYEPGEDGLETVEAVDIVVNEVSATPRAVDPWAARLEQGVLDTMVEHVLATTPGDNTWARFSADPGGWTVARSAEDLDALGAALSDVELGRIRAQLDDGGVVVIGPTDGAAPATWWHVDAASGTTLGLGQNGWGANLPENRSVSIVASNTVRAAARRQLGKKWVGEAADTGRLAGRIQAAHARSRGIQVEEINQGVIVRIYNLGK